MAGQEMLEQLLGDRLLAQLEGEPAEVVGDLAVFGQQLQRGLVARKSAPEVAGLLAGDGQQPPAMPLRSSIFSALIAKSAAARQSSRPIAAML